MFDDKLIENSKSPPHMGETVKAKVLSVYDGDTVTVAYNINNLDTCPFVISVRLANIDAPEKKTLNNLEKKASILLTEFITSKLLNKIIDLSIISWDKYGGRIVGVINLDEEFNNISVNDWLLNNKLVKNYDGKTKKEEWTNEELETIIKFFS